MEQTHAGKSHDHVILVRGSDHVVITDGTARFGNVLNAGLAGAFHIVAEGEERVGAAGDTALPGDPGFFLLCGQNFGLYFESGQLSAF